MNQVDPALNPALYAACEYQKAKDILANSTLVPLDTRECYYTRFALWIHYCNKHHGGDDKATGSRVADYVDWLVSSGVTDSIRQDHTRLQQQLRSQLQGVRRYWSLQNSGGDGVQDPLRSEVFLERWRAVIERYPCQRTMRHAGVGGGLTDSESD
ncbi:hypothetical protein IW152_006054 [Coemansia sp. BCRC 34962]|nr:hypothetical protein IW152_006054 [Coemansia sp. BCRC 34962]